MKRFIYIIAAASALTLGACNKWLDVNENPNSANAAVPTAVQRLPSILAQFADAYESAGTRAAFITQQLGVVNANNNNWNMTRWNLTNAAVGWPWQAWYVNTAVNIQPMIDAASKVGANHYVGVGKIIKAWGFGFMVDCYGILPYDEFDNKDILTPKFDEGEYVYSKVLALLDEAIQDLSKAQDQYAPSLKDGDTYNSGDTQKWLKLAYGLKVRFLNHYSKKANYNPDEILNLLAKAPSSSLDGTIYQYIDEGPDVADNSKAALQWSNTGTTARITKLYYDYITNNYTGAPSGANNMVDPRLDLLVPSMDNGTGVLVRTKVVDMQSALPTTGPVAVTFDAKTNKFSHADSVYIQLRSNKATSGRVLSTGTWYTQKGGKGLLLTGAEMKFIEAEIRFRKGQLAQALQAYKDGIRIHMEILGVKSEEIGKYLASTSVVQDISKLNLSHIMIQKYIALSYSPEQWVDLRRMDFCTDVSGNYNEASGIYKGFNRPGHVFTNSFPNSTDWPRRFAIASYENSYNLDQVKKADPDAGTPTYITKPVFWDKK
ncbi:SusD/RagB family nutrient-binding outer membrane lipoprotein [Sphingobacterium sp. InxBP1]|uniref:SusD/RagB family nutrient-binding outer membrane lipoprotein n=1 Tax=Sphingobacterium sp. InxBP1 TaxID=2870328 RepID=UPI002243B02A|nr:SusD/RagB family nutrient-binding outer membrane lipoprotein [Sphingobacterium sp. InxBP1]MCW8312430.1 SusD/RagB family nutrient-binding outer membrane lipoprotein [Sphingobacterium sp. InxBP1]